MSGGLEITDERDSCEEGGDRRRRLSGGGLIPEAMIPVPTIAMYNLVVIEGFGKDSCLANIVALLPNPVVSTYIYFQHKSITQQI